MVENDDQLSFPTEYIAVANKIIKSKHLRLNFISAVDDGLLEIYQSKHGVHKHIFPAFKAILNHYGENLERNPDARASYITDRKSDIKSGKVDRYIPVFIIWMKRSCPITFHKIATQHKIKYVKTSNIPALNQVINPTSKNPKSDSDVWSSRVDGTHFQIMKHKSLGLQIPSREKFDVWTSLEMKYTQANTKFIGRDKERKALDDFMLQSDSFAWWQIAGTAGQGKSRLALKLAKKYNKLGWDAGFVTRFNKKFIKKVEGYNAKSNVLIIVDYASDAKKSNLLRNLVAELIDKASSTNYKIRLLILDRQPYDQILLIEPELLHPQFLPASWQYDLVHPRSSEANVARKYLFNKKQALNLTSPTNKELRKIALAWASSKLLAQNRLENTVGSKSLTKEQQKQVDEFLGITNNEENSEAKVTRINCRRRPLFAILAADAVLRNISTQNNAKRNSFELLLDFALDHDAELMFGRATGNTEGYALRVGSELQRDMALFANIVGKYNVFDTTLTKGKKYDVSECDVGKAFRLLGYSFDINTADYDQWLVGRQPDILAEYQFLRSVQKWCKIGNKSNIGNRKRYDRILELLSIAWNFSAEETDAFYRRVWQNFPNHPAIILLAEPTPTHQSNLEIWSRTMMHSSRYMEADHLAYITNKLDYLAFNDDTEIIHLAYFKLTIVWVVALFKEQGLDNSDFIISTMDVIFQESKKADVTLARILARGATVLLYSQKGRNDFAVNFYHQFEDTFTENSEGVYGEIHSIVLKELVDMLLCFDELTPATFYYDRLRNLLETNESPFVLQNTLSTALRLIEYFCLLGLGQESSEWKLEKAGIAFNNIAMLAMLYTVDFSDGMFLLPLHNYAKILVECGNPNQIEEFNKFVEDNLANHLDENNLSKLRVKA